MQPSNKLLFSLHSCITLYNPRSNPPSCPLPHRTFSPLLHPTTTFHHLHSTTTFHHLPPTSSWTIPLCPPPSPTRQTLLPTSQILEQHDPWLVPGSLGRLVITLARECVFGRDLMTTGNLSKEVLLFIKNTIR